VTALCGVCNLHQVPIWRMLYAGNIEDWDSRALDWQRLATYVVQRRRGRLLTYRTTRKHSVCEHLIGSAMNIVIIWRLCKLLWCCGADMTIYLLLLRLLQPDSAIWNCDLLCSGCGSLEPVL
jgi:hypothetical protein